MNVFTKVGRVPNLQEGTEQGAFMSCFDLRASRVAELG